MKSKDGVSVNVYQSPVWNCILLLLSISVGSRNGVEAGREGDLREVFTSVLRNEWLKLVEVVGCSFVLCPPQAIDLFE